MTLGSGGWLGAPLSSGNLMDTTSSLAPQRKWGNRRSTSRLTKLDRSTPIPNTPIPNTPHHIIRPEVVERRKEGRETAPRSPQSTNTLGEGHKSKPHTGEAMVPQSELWAILADIEALRTEAESPARSITDYAASTRNVKALIRDKCASTIVPLSAIKKGI